MNVRKIHTTINCYHSLFPLHYILQSLFLSFSSRSHVDDIDIFVAVVSERPMRGALVGPTLACLLGRQFNRFKFGDRFWYETAQGEQAFTDGKNKLWSLCKE